MKRCVIFDFQEDFKFPEQYGDNVCEECPLNCYDDMDAYCFVTGDSPWKTEHEQCPFYSGSVYVDFN